MLLVACNRKNVCVKNKLTPLTGNKGINLSRPTTAVNYSIRYVWECLHMFIFAVYIMQITDNANIRKSVGHIGLFSCMA